MTTEQSELAADLLSSLKCWAGDLENRLFALNAARTSGDDLSPEERKDYHEWLEEQIVELDGWHQIVLGFLLKYHDIIAMAAAI